MDPLRIIVIGQSAASLDSLQTQLAALLPRFRVQTAVGPAEALGEMAAGDVIANLVCVGQEEEEAQAAQLLCEIQDQRLGVPVFIIAPKSDIHQRLRFLELGAVDCLSWPVDLARLAALIDVLSVRRRLAIRQHPGAGDSDRRATPQDGQPGEIAGFRFACPALRSLRDQLEAAADSESHILLTGETGTGKSHVARAIHDLSPRRKRPFVVVECGRLSSELLASEWFGHVRGAFTGADRDHDGRLSAAGKGTVLLDEIDCVPMAAQAKLLRVLEEREYQLVGSTKTVPFPARVIAATNQPLNQLVEQGEFRRDLFFRLNVVEFRLPPLRKCREAIVLLAEKFLHFFAQRDRRPAREFSFEALNLLQEHVWPGNVRELRNAVERAVILCRREVISPRELPESVWQPSNGHRFPAGVGVLAGKSPLEDARYQGERQRLEEALRNSGNNRTRTARALGISRAALYKKLRKFGLDRE